MQAVLYSKTGQFSGTSFKINGDVTIGKSSSNSIQLRANIVSGSHAKITFDGEQKVFYLEDLGSSNGTQLDGIKVTSREKLDRLHVITFAGKFDFIFQVDGAVPQRTNPPVSEPARATKHDAPAKPSETSSAEKTVVESSNQGLPSFGDKKDEPAGEKTMLEQPSAGGLPSFGKKPEQEKPKETDIQKTMADSGQGGGALPSFGKPKETPPEPPKEEPKADDQQKTMMEQPAAGGLPSFGKKPEAPAPPSEQATELMDSVKPSDPAPEPPQQPSPASSSKPHFVLQVEKTNKEFELTNGANTIGRIFGSDIIIDDNSLSRKHASIVVSGDKLTITDLGSRNGTFVDKKKINSEVEITAGSAIKLGLVEMKIKKVN